MIGKETGIMKGTRKDKEHVIKTKSMTRRLGIASLLFNGGVLVFVLHVMFSTGNVMLVLPFIVVSLMVNAVVINKMRGLFKEAGNIVGERSTKPREREAGEETMLDGLRKDLRVTKQMLMDREFWELVFDDVKDAIREAKNR